MIATTIILLLACVVIGFAVLQTTQTLRLIKQRKQESSRVVGRINQFYSLFNQQNWKGCFDTLDPKLNGKIDFLWYNQNMAHFYKAYGPIQILDVKVSLHLDVPSNMWNETNFAYAKVVWKDKHNRKQTFQERWVKTPKDGNWYTRKAGLI